MPISVQCPSCGKKLTAKDELAGKKATCPGCKKLFVIPAARPLSQPKPLAPAEPAATTTYRAAYRRRRKLNLLPWYIGGGIVLCLTIVLVIIFSMSGGDRSIAKNTEPVSKADTKPKSETKPAPKPPEPRSEPKPEVTRTDPSPEVKPEPARAKA